MGIKSTTWRTILAMIFIVGSATLAGCNDGQSDGAEPDASADPDGSTLDGDEDIADSRDSDGASDTRDTDTSIDPSSAARYFGQLEVDVGFPQQLEDGTLIYQFKRDVPADPLPVGSAPGAESVPAIGRGPACVEGAPYAVLAQEGPYNGPNNIVIETQGGGICYVDSQSAGDCLAPNLEARRTWPFSGDTTFVSDDSALNPFTSDWDRVYLPYCDNSMFASDTNAVPAIGEAADQFRYYRGTQNFTAGLQIARQLNPSPDKILLSGFLVGGYGVVINIPLVREVFPNAEIYVFTDGGTLVGDRSGEPGFLADTIRDFNGEFYLPGNCSDCLGDGTLFRAAAAFINQSKGDAPTRVALATGIKNITIAQLLLGYDNTIEDYVDIFVNALLDLDEAVQPSEFAAFLGAGNQSTMSGIAARQSVDSKFDVVLDGVRYGDWIADFLDPSTAWSTVSEVPLER